MKKGKFPKFSIGGFYGAAAKDIFIGGLNFANPQPAGFGFQGISEDKYDNTSTGRSFGKLTATKKSFDSMAPGAKISKKMNPNLDSQTSMGMNDAQYQEYQKWQPIAAIGSKAGEIWTGAAVGGAIGGAGGGAITGAANNFSNTQGQFTPEQAAMGAAYGAAAGYGTGKKKQRKEDYGPAPEGTYTNDYASYNMNDPANQAGGGMNAYINDRRMAAFRNGGKMPNLYNMGGIQPNAEVEGDEFITSNQLPKVAEGGNIEMASNNPYSDPTFKTNGLTHEEGGIKVNLAPGSIINGKTKNPLTGNKFSKDMDMITKKEARFTKHAEKGGVASKTSDLMLKALANQKNTYNALQNAIIANKEEAKALSKGQIPGMDKVFAMGGIQKFDGGGTYKGKTYLDDYSLQNALKADGDNRSLLQYRTDKYNSEFGNESEPSNTIISPSNYVSPTENRIAGGPSKASINEADAIPDYTSPNEMASTNTKMANNNPTGTPRNGSNWKGTVGDVGMFLANNMGNLYNLSRYNKPEVETYERAKPTYLDPKASIAHAKRIERNTFKKIKDASTGNAATALSNMASARANTTMDIDRIERDYANANAGIANQFNMYNTGLSKEEVIANAMNRARNRSGQGEAIGSIGYNTANQMRDKRLGDMDQKTLALMMEYYNDPNFKKYMEKSGFKTK